MSNLNKVFFSMEKHIESDGYAECLLELLKELIEPNEEVEFNIVLTDRIARKIAKKEFVISEINKIIAIRENIIS